MAGRAPKNGRTGTQPDPSLREVRQKFGANVSDEELILRFFAGDDAVNALPNDGKPQRISGRNPAPGETNRAAQQAQRLEPDLY